MKSGLSGASAVEAPQYGVGVPSGVSAASFNDMHNLIRKANEEQAAAMMSEGKAGKVGGERDVFGTFVANVAYIGVGTRQPIRTSSVP